MKRFFIFIIGGSFSLVLVASLIFYIVFSFYTDELPDYQQLSTYDPPVVTRLYASNGQLFHEYAKEKRVFLPITEIPQHIINTFLAAEDKNFYHHQGIDASGILRAIVKNFQNFLKGRRLTGASTITQQVAKNFLLGNEISFSRKIKEAILAFRLEKAFSKEKILELYLNEIYLGGGAYGVAAASLHYFNKALDELTISEAAFLASLPKAPNSYHPIHHYDKAIARRNWVIDRMLENTLISAEQAQSAKQEALIPHFHNPDKDVAHADFFAEEVRRELVSRFGVSELYKGGLTVKTTLDPRLQTIADDVLRESLTKYDRRYGWRGAFANLSIENWQDNLNKFKSPPGLSPFLLAIVLDVKKDKAIIGLKNGTVGEIPLKEMLWARLHKETKEKRPYVGPPIKLVSEVLKVGDVIAVNPLKENIFSLAQIPEVGGAIVVIDPHTGRVLAMSGGYSFEISEFNRATQAMRQPGSAFKAFAYLLAFEKGYTPVSQILDAPVEIDIGWGLGKWKPKNMSERFYGKVPLRRAFEKSYNASTVQLAKALGIRDIIDLAIRLGVYDDTLPAQWAMVLGAGETTLLKLTSAFAMIANGGKKIVPTFIDRVQDRRGRTLYKSDLRTINSSVLFLEKQGTPLLLEDTRERISDPASIYQLTSLMQGVVERGTGKTGKVEGFPLAGKSGTSSDYRDAWFIGFSPNLVVGIFIGFDTPKSLGNKETGGDLVSPIFGEFMKRALKGQIPVPFKSPPGLKFKRISLDTGKLATPNDKNVILEGFKPGTEPSPDVPPPPPIGSEEFENQQHQQGNVPLPPDDASFFKSLHNLLKVNEQEEKGIPPEESIEDLSLLNNDVSLEDVTEAPFEIPTHPETSSSFLPVQSLPPVPPPIPQKPSETTVGTGALF